MARDSLAMLSMFTFGSLTIGVSGIPLLRLDAESRSIDIEAKGIKECGIKLSTLVEEKGGEPKKKAGRSSLFELFWDSGELAGTLSKMGWRLTLYSSGDKIFTMGLGISGLTGHMRFSPMKLREILNSLF